MGHTKTICVLLGGAAVFGEVIGSRTALGMALAVAGMVGYGYFTAVEKAAEAPPSPRAAAAAAVEAESARLLGNAATPEDTHATNGDSSSLTDTNGTYQLCVLCMLCLLCAWPVWPVKARRCGGACTPVRPVWRRSAFDYERAALTA